MSSTAKLLAERGLPEFFLDGSQKYAFDAEKIFQDFYLLGKETNEFNGKIASDLTTKALAIITTHKHLDSIKRQEVHNAITDVLFMSGFAAAATFVEQRQPLQVQSAKTKTVLKP